MRARASWASPSEKRPSRSFYLTPMMTLVFGHGRMTADDVRALMREVATRLAKERAAETGERP